MEKNIKSEMLEILKKNEAMEAELNYIKEENEIMKTNLKTLEKEIKYHNSQIKSKEHDEERVYENEVEAADPESNNSSISCEKCDFVAKSEAGLKTHDTVKHKKSMFRAYSKVSK